VGRLTTWEESLRSTAVFGSLAALVLSVGACGSANEAVSEPLSATPSTATPSAVGPSVPAGVPTELPPAPSAQAKTQESANQFATYVALLDYRAVYTRDVAPLLGLVAPGDRCTECEHAQREVEQAHPLFAVPAGEPKVLSAVPTSRHGDEYVVGVAYRTPAAKVVDASGEVVGDLQPYPHNYTEVRLRWDEAADVWHLLDYHVQKGGGDV
jgi:hypothetical protein